MGEQDEDDLVIRMTVEHLLADGEWPKLRDLHRRAHQGLQTEVDVRAAAKRIAPHPLFSGYDDLGDTFAPSLPKLARVPECEPIVDGVLTLVVLAREKYLSSTGEVEITDHDLRTKGLSPEITAAVHTVAGGIPFLTHGGSSGPEGWRVTVSDDVTRWIGTESRDDLLNRLTTFEQERNREYAAMAAAKARLVQATSGEQTGRVVELGSVRMQPTRYYQSAALSLGAGASRFPDAGVFPPRRSLMPDLSRLYSMNILPLILNITLRAQGSVTHPSLAYTAGYVRLVDKAVREYEFARRALEEFVHSGAEHLSPYFRAADHLENCLNSTRRAIRYARRIRREREALDVEKDEIPTEADELRVAYFRNATEHAESEVATGQRREGEPVILMLYEGSFSLGQERESYEWLAGLLDGLHVLASRVAGVERPGEIA